MNEELNELNSQEANFCAVWRGGCYWKSPDGDHWRITLIDVRDYGSVKQILRGVRRCRPRLASWSEMSTTLRDETDGASSCQQLLTRGSSPSSWPRSLVHSVKKDDTDPWHETVKYVRITFANTAP